MKTIRNVIAVTLVGATMFSLTACGGTKIEAVSESDFIDALEKYLDEDGILDYDTEEADNTYYYEGDYFIDYYKYNDADDAKDRFEEIYELYNNARSNNDLDGTYSAVSMGSYGYILLDCDSDDPSFSEGYNYGGIYWTEDVLIICIFQDDSSSGKSNIDGILDEIGYPHP